VESTLNGSDESGLAMTGSDERGAGGFKVGTEPFFNLFWGPLKG
jgi:hypothetical protein